MSVVMSKNGYTQVIWQTPDANMSKHRIPCCEHFNSISNRWKIFFFLSLVGVVSAVSLTSYSQRCGFTSCSVVMSHPLSEVTTLKNQPISNLKLQRLDASKLDANSWTNHSDSSAVFREPADLDNDHTPADRKVNIPTHPPLARRFPHFILIGTKKSGTRALLNYLAIHPDIVTVGQEVHFFDRDESYKKGLNWYKEQMPYSRPGQLTGEKSPSYYRVSSVPERIRKMNASIQLIVVVKEPIDRAMSNYLQFQSKRVEKDETIPLDHPTFEEAVIDGSGNVRGNSPHIRNSHYYLFLKNWLKSFPLEQILFVDGNLLITKPWKVMEEAQNFLGLRQAVTKDDFKFDVEKGFYCYRNSSKSHDFSCFNESKGRKHPDIKPDLRKKLSQYFKPRNIQFFRAIKKSFEWNT